MRLTLACLLTITTALPAFADGHVRERMTGTIVNRAGENVGSVSVFDTASGLVHVLIAASPLPPGPHGLHFHEVGECEGDFSSAGGHISGDADHGSVEGGPHPGDMPNGYVEVEALNYETFMSWLTIDEHMIDADGSALIIHSDRDDYVSQPSGDAGDRIACAVLTEAPG